jgi:hypothetical protein
VTCSPCWTEIGFVKEPNLPDGSRSYVSGVGTENMVLAGAYPGHGHSIRHDAEGSIGIQYQRMLAYCSADPKQFRREIGFPQRSTAAGSSSATTPAGNFHITSGRAIGVIIVFRIAQRRRKESDHGTRSQIEQNLTSRVVISQLPQKGTTMRKISLSGSRGHRYPCDGSTTELACEPECKHPCCEHSEQPPQPGCSCCRG